MMRRLEDLADALLLLVLYLMPSRQKNEGGGPVGAPSRTHVPVWAVRIAAGYVMGLFIGLGLQIWAGWN